MTMKATAPEIPRTLDLRALAARKSHFLVRQSLPGARLYDLLDASVYLALSRDPTRLGQELTPQDRVVVIDEIQRLPELLDEGHRLIEGRGTRFLLTGSSARKLRRGGVNLLGGRARTRYLHPLTSRELGPHFDLRRAVARGSLPSIYFSDDPRADLEAYAGSYLKEEIVAEGATRNAPAFSRFLTVAAFCNGPIVNSRGGASDAQVARTTVYEYFEILRDTLVLHELPAWRKSKKRKPIASSKYYFFDVGVVGALQDRQVRPGTPEFGEAVETYLMHELASYRDYVSGPPLAYRRSTSGFEVDSIVGDHTAVEVKAKPNIGPRDVKSLRALAEEAALKRYLCVSLEPRRRRLGEITILPVTDFLEALWDGEIA